MDKEILAEIKKLMGYECKVDGKEEMEKPIIVLAPKLGSSKPEKISKKLRVYAYGGLIGEIPTSQKQRASLVNKRYLKYLPENSNKKSELEKRLSESKTNENAQVLHTLFSDDYLKLVIEACRNKFTNKTRKLKERVIETQLVKKYLGNTDIWVPIDIEFLVPKDWVDPGSGTENEKRKGKPDIILYDRRVRSFRLIELKYDEESCTGNNSLSHHYNNAMNIIKSKHQKEIIDEFFRKMKFLYDSEIISGEVWKEVLKSTDRDKVKLKFGYFFIKGDLKTYQTYVRTQLGNTDKNCSFLYSPDIDTDILKNCQMLSYDEFMKYKEEV